MSQAYSDPNRESEAQETAMARTYYVINGDLHDYETGDYVRPATDAEAQSSERAAKMDGGRGVIKVSEA